METRAETEALAGVLAALDLREVEPDVYAAAPYDDLGVVRSFGGQLIAQGLVAAARTVEGGVPAHSLHAYFLRPGDPDGETLFRVGRLRDGRRLRSRSVSVEQAGRVLATMTVSFAEPAPGFAHQADAPQSPPPETLPTLAEWTEPHGGLADSWLGMRTVETRVAPHPPAGPSLAWHRMAGTVPDNPLLHQALLVYLSDVTTLSAALVPHGFPLGIEEVDGVAWDAVSLDHAVWFHRPARADDWLLFAQQTPAAADGRAFIRAEVFTRDGVLAASITQEGLFFEAT
ncbi:acyl-CoA thioesterase [Actinocorallia sp. A-T 12471]|uniref:acyl-CoA thioesterase n=1 Tax=Actinocorallia sp. A-T 12471 TaxID=3089813 RepID=UPI0029CE0B73|nr:acyl-CoA thioesterase domain-containing protein [Actinocorallia sp. A-T 12471]MDX6740872.1 thioesterase family protein [Actinocorallia sp. A-T 12471]